MDIKLFNKNITLRDYYCRFFDKIESKITSPYINLYVKFKGCNADCSFCEYKDDANGFNFNKYEEILSEIDNQNIELRKLAFTGGEPTLNYSKFSDILNYSRDRLPNNYISMNTNGLNLNRMYNDGLFDKLDDISLSRHHYDDNINNSILKFNSVSNDDIKNIQKTNKKDIIQFSCNLIDGHIDSHDEILKILEFANDHSVYKVGLVSLMPINEYCIDKFVGSDIFDETNGKFFKSKQFEQVGYCKCMNYLYTPTNFNGEHVKMYLKNTYKNQEISNTLLFDGEYLRDGFGGKIIY